MVLCFWYVDFKMCKLSLRSLINIAVKFAIEVLYMLTVQKDTEVLGIRFR